jgi:hypothetical protein
MCSLMAWPTVVPGVKGLTRGERKRRACTVAVDEIENTRGEAGFNDELAKLEGRQRCHLRNLVAASQYRSHQKKSVRTFITIVLPVASAGPTFHDNINTAKEIRSTVRG